MEEVPGRVKAYCPKCYMTFEAGKQSKRVSSHLQISQCDSIPCPKSRSNCVRKFASVNAANRHTYCFTAEQVKGWDPNLSIEDLGIDFSSLKIEDDDIDQYLNFSPVRMQQMFQDSMTLTEFFTRLQDEGEGTEDSDFVRHELVERGFSNVGTLRRAFNDHGNWGFLTTGLDAKYKSVARTIANMLEKYKQ